MLSKQALHSGIVASKAVWEGAIAEVCLAPSAAEQFQELPYVFLEKVVAKLNYVCYVLLNFRVKRI
jgi:hypothetical protein